MGWPTAPTNFGISETSNSPCSFTVIIHKSNIGGFATTYKQHGGTQLLFRIPKNSTGGVILLCMLLQDCFGASVSS